MKNHWGQSFDAMLPPTLMLADENEGRIAKMHACRPNGPATVGVAPLSPTEVQDPR